MIKTTNDSKIGTDYMFYPSYESVFQSYLDPMRVIWRSCQNLFNPSSCKPACTFVLNKFYHNRDTRPDICPACSLHNQIRNSFQKKK